MIRRDGRSIAVAVLCSALAATACAGGERAPAQPRPTRTMNLGEFPISALALSPDGKVLAVGGGDGRVGLWDYQTGRYRLTLKEMDRRLHTVGSLAISPDGSLLVAASQSDVIGIPGPMTGTLTAWDLPAGRQRASLPGLGYDLGPMGFSADGKAFHVEATAQFEEWYLEFDAGDMG